MSYEAFFKAKAPRWLRRVVGDKFWTVAGGMMDTVTALAREAANQSFHEHAADDAVPFHLRDSLLEQIEGETIAAQRVRIDGRWTFWSELAPTTKIRDAIRLYTGLTALELYPFNGDNTADPWSDGYVVGLDDDNNIENWSRHTIVIPQPHPWERPIVGPDLVVGPDLMVGLTMTQNELKQIRRAYRKHRPGHMVGMLIHVLLDSTVAEDYLLDHAFTSEVVKLALQVQMVGYPSTAMMVGPSCVVGDEFV